MSVTFDAVPFDRHDEREIVAGEGTEAPDGDVARRWPLALEATHAGASAVSRTGDFVRGHVDDALITAVCGEVDEGSTFG